MGSLLLALAHLGEALQMYLEQFLQFSADVQQLSHLSKLISFYTVGRGQSAGVAGHTKGLAGETRDTRTPDLSTFLPDDLYPLR